MSSNADTIPDPKIDSEEPEQNIPPAPVAENPQPAPEVDDPNPNAGPEPQPEPQPEPKEEEEEEEKEDKDEKKEKAPEAPMPQKKPAKESTKTGNEMADFFLKMMDEMMRYTKEQDKAFQQELVARAEGMVNGIFAKLKSIGNAIQNLGLDAELDQKVTPPKPKPDEKKEDQEEKVEEEKQEDNQQNALPIPEQNAIPAPGAVVEEVQEVVKEENPMAAPQAPKLPGNDPFDDVDVPENDAKGPEGDQVADLDDVIHVKP